VVVNNLDLVWTVFRPGETDPKLLIDPNAESSLPPAGQRLEPISWRNAQIFKNGNRVDLFQLSRSNSPKFPRTRFASVFGIPSVENVLRSGTTEGNDH